MPRPVREFIFAGSVREIADGTFNGNKDLRVVVLNEGLEVLGGIGNKDHWQYRGAFCGAKLKQITLPSTLLVLGDRTFQGCSELGLVTLREGSRLE